MSRRGRPVEKEAVIESGGARPATSRRLEGEAAARAVPLGALLAAAVATLLAAFWVREPAVSYLVGALVATTASVAAGWRPPSSRRWVLAIAAAALTFATPALWTQRSLERTRHDWTGARDAQSRAAEDAIARHVSDAAAALTRAADLAIATSRADRPAFDAIAPLLPEGRGERALVVLDAGRPAAWSGVLRVPLEPLRERVGVALTTFYVVVYATAERGTRRAVATEVLHAASPANVLARAADRTDVAEAEGWSFDFAAPGARQGPSWHIVRWRGSPIVALRSTPPAPETVLTRAIERGRTRAAPGLALLVVVLTAAAWRRSPRAPGRLLARRLGVLIVPLLAVRIVPLSSLSNATHLFDPAVFFAPHGGRFADSLGALALTGTVLLLGLFALLRAGRRVVNVRGAFVLVVGIVGAGPYLLRDLARGIQPPPLGTSVNLWVAWQLALFLPAVALLIAGATAGRVALGRFRGVSPIVAPLLGAAAALSGPLLWRAPSGWPIWYVLLWIAAAGAVALTRQTRGIVVAAAAVAGLGASTLVWSVVAAKRVDLAIRDVASLTTPDVDAERLLERLARDLLEGDPPGTSGALLQRYADSPLAAADYPVTLRSWAPTGIGDSVVAEVATAEATADSAGVRALVASARSHGDWAVATMRGDPGVSEVLAVPHPGGRVTTVAVFPRTRLLPESPLAPLIGLRRRGAGEPPYAVSVEWQNGPMPPGDLAPRFKREGNEVHGDWNVASGDAWAHAHVEIELRALGALAQRGGLLVLLDLLVVGVLWTVPAAADGTVTRRLRVWRSAWRRSYRARLTIALFTFFVVPAATFAVWSYRQLQSSDRQSREILVRETLRTAATEAPAADARALSTLGERLGTPLLVYAAGELQRATSPLFFDLAPIGLLLPPRQTIDVVLGNEGTSSASLALGVEEMLFGFRAAQGAGTQRFVVAAPARTDDVVLEQRRRDLGFLVILVAAGGALAALWLSGLAARELARPVGTLRGAALAIAAGEREPGLGAEPPAEFRPVFAAFRRMAADLSESRSALEAAQRRTAAVLRNVASGVLAVREDGQITIANPRAELLLGARLPAGAPLRTVGPASLVDRVDSFLADARRHDANTTSGDDEFDLELHGRQLRARLTRLSAARVGDDGAAVLTLDDLTELARAQRVLAWGEMARQVAHEIKNPLTPIRLGVQHLRRAYVDRRGNFDEILHRNVERVLAEIDRLDEIARSFSRYGTAPDQRPPGIPTDVGAVARDVVALERLGQSAVTWEVIVAPQTALALAREDELREVLLNLLENARHANASLVRVTVDADADGVTIRVADDGEGIADEVQARVFEPHFSTRTSGSGLGLAISRRMVEGWGGTVSLRSPHGEGTTVTVSLRPAATTMPAADPRSETAD